MSRDKKIYLLRGLQARRPKSSLPVFGSNLSVHALEIFTMAELVEM
ncbi:MAG: hypothetical protein K8F91_23635 [Candidatus Obscuribacterales bacterium]|nr:hypothetical protein [Candidatus Obscuribacterales bacterium]